MTNRPLPIAARRAGSTAPGRRDDGVSDVLGSVLLIGITVIMAAVLGFLLLSFDGPQPIRRAQVSVSADPGLGGWGTGDETVRILHAGGEPLEAGQMSVLLSVGGTSSTLTGASGLGSAWADGKLTIGETWQRTTTIAANTPVSVVLVDSSTPTVAVLSDVALVTSTTTTTQPCASDTTAPTVVQWSQSPATITATTTGAISITAQLTDNCWGPNPAIAPTFYYRITNNGAGAWTSTGGMTSVGAARWGATVPSQSWGSLVGYQLQYYIGPLVDLGGNSGDAPVRSSPILLDCSTDITNPTFTSITQSPANIGTTTVGAITITVVVADDCAGIDTTQNPRIFWRINAGSGGTYTDAGAMTNTATNTWQGTIPSQSWVLHAGSTLEYYVTGVRDRNGNLGTSATQSDTIEVISTYTYVGTNTPTTGTVTAFSNMQSASDSGAEGSIAEGGLAGTPATQTFNANGAVLANGWTSATSSFASDNVYASYATNSPTSSNDLRVAVQDPAVTGAVTSVVIKAEVSITSHANDGFRLQACLNSGTCTAYGSTAGGSATDTTVTYDVTSIRPGGGSWSLADVTNLEPVVGLVQSGSRDGTWRVDRIWAEVTVQTTTYSTNVQLGWSGVPAGLGVRNLELRYRVSGDTFNVQVCQDALPACGTWTTRGSVLNAAGLTSWTYSLTTAEYNLGAPRIRFTDVAPTGTTQGNLFLDYARVATL